MNGFFVKNGKKIDFLIKHCFNGLLAVMAVCFLIFSVSCSNLTTDSFQQSKSGSGISIVVSNYNINSGVSIAKSTIAPATYSLSNILNYRIEGEDCISGETFSSNITITNGEGSLSDIEPSVWKFILHAYSDSSAQNEVLRGVSVVDLSQVDEVSFVLTSSNVTTNGSYAITMLYNDANSYFTEMVGEIHAWLCDQNTGEHLYRFAEVTTASDLALWRTSGYLVSNNSIEPGHYVLEITFYQIVNSTSKRIGFWSEILVVEPGRQTVQTITIPDIIAHKPADPTNLMMYRVENSLSADSYNAVIRWTDASNNEENFVLKIYEYDSTSTTTGNVTHIITPSNHQSLTLTDDGIGYVAGSVCYSSEEYVVKLRTGRLYDVQIYASNSYGVSSTVSRVASTDISNDSTYGNLIGFGVSNSAPYTRVNTFCLSYYLENGKMLLGRSNAYTGQTYYEYKIYTGSTMTLLVPATIDPDDTLLADQEDWPILYYGTIAQPWTNWYADGDSTQAAVTSISTFTNRKFHAVYDMQTSVELYFDDDAFYLTKGATEAGSYYGTGTNIKNSLTISKGDFVTITIDRSATPNSEFTRFDYYINDTAQDYELLTLPSAQTYVTFTTQFPLKGTFKLTISGAKSDQYFYSEEYVITVE